MFGIDHARTLAVVLPAMLQVRREAKRDKLLRYAERVWSIRDGADEARIDAAIQRTRDFFERLGLPTRLSAHSVTAAAIPAIVDQLKAHGMVALGERRGKSHPDVCRAVLAAAL